MTQLTTAELTGPLRNPGKGQGEWPISGVGRKLSGRQQLPHLRPMLFNNEVGGNPIYITLAPKEILQPR